MADPLGTITNIIDLLCKTKELHKKFKDVKDLPESFGKIAAQINLAKSILKKIQADESAGSQSKLLQDAIVSCVADVKDLNAIYEQAEKNRQSKWQQRWLEAVKSVAKDRVGTVEELWERILRGVQLLAAGHGLEDLSDIKKAIAEIHSIRERPSSLETADVVTYNNHAHTVGVQVSVSGGFVMYSNSGAGPISMFLSAATFVLQLRTELEKYRSTYTSEERQHAEVAQPMTDYSEVDAALLYEDEAAHVEDLPTVMEAVYAKVLTDNAQACQVPAKQSEQRALPRSAQSIPEEHMQTHAVGPYDCSVARGRATEKLPHRQDLDPNMQELTFSNHSKIETWLNDPDLDTLAVHISMGTGGHNKQ